MKKHHLLLATALLALPSLLHAQTSSVPGFINYRGRVLNSSGGLVGSGTPVNRTVIFRVWDHPSNTTAANLLYSEEQTVTIAEGDFSVLVGQGVSTNSTQFGYSETAKKLADVGAAFGGSGRYLGVTVDDGTAAADNEITPRQQMVSSAFSFRSKVAESLASSSGTALAVADSGRIGVGNTAPPALFTITGANSSTTTNTPQMLITADDMTERLRLGVDSSGNSTGFLQTWKEGTGATNLLLNPNGGNVGIGNTNPTAKLDVTGTIAASGAITSGGAISALGSGGHVFNSGDLDGGLFSPADGVVTLNTNGNERMRLNALGNVGIGTSSPNSTLHVNGSCTFGPTSGNNFVVTGNQIQHYSNGTQAPMFLNWTGGSVVVGNGDPSKGLLAVGPGIAANLNANKFFDGTVNIIVSGGGGTLNTSIYATNWIITGNGYTAVSDARIKRIDGVSDGASDLDTLSKIQITNYHYKDMVSNGGEQHKKLIAQQVEQVFPQAVRRTTDVIPDIYQRASFKDGWVTLDTNLKKGERVRLVTKKEETVFEVLQAKAGAFRTDLKTDDAEIFVYGREVKDFRSVDYDAVSMLNVSATQQIKKEKDAEIAALEAKLAAQDKRLGELEAKDKARDAKLAAFERLLHANAKATAHRVSLKPHAGAE